MSDSHFIESKTLEEVRFINSPDEVDEILGHFPELLPVADNLIVVASGLARAAQRFGAKQVLDQVNQGRLVGIAQLESLENNLRQALDSVPSHTRRILEWMALAGGIQPDLADTGLSFEPGETIQILNRLFDAGWAVSEDESVRLKRPLADIVRDLTDEERQVNWAKSFARAQEELDPEQAHTQVAGARLALKLLVQNSNFDAAARCALTIHQDAIRHGNLNQGRTALETIVFHEQTLTPELMLLVFEALSYPSYYTTEENGAELYARKTLAQAYDLEEFARAARIELNLARVLYYEGDFEESLKHARACVEAARQSNSDLVMSGALGGASLIESYLGTPRDAQQALDEATHLWARTPELNKNSRLTSSLAWSQVGVFRAWQNAAKMFEQAGQTADDDYSRGLAQAALAEVMLHSGLYDRALELVDASLPENVNRGFEELAGHNRIVRATALMAQEDYEGARLEWLAAGRYDDPHYRSMVELFIGATDVALGAMDRAEDRFQILFNPAESLPWDMLNLWFAFAARVLSGRREVSELVGRAETWPVRARDPVRQGVVQTLLFGGKAVENADVFERLLVAVSENFPVIGGEKRTTSVCFLPLE